MRKFVTITAVGLSIIAAGLTVAPPASAGVAAGRPNYGLHRLRNADTHNGNFYLGIPGGPQNGSVPDDRNLVIWNLGQNDQRWWVPDGDAFGEFYDYYTDPSNNQVCITVASDGFHLIDHPCDGSQIWQMIGSNKVGLGNTYPGCFIMWNINTSKAMGVQGRVMQNGTAVVQWSYDGTANQFWCEA